MKMEFWTRSNTCDPMNWATSPGHPSLSPAHAESGPGMTVTLLQDLGPFLSNPVGAPAAGGTDLWGTQQSVSSQMKLGRKDPLEV